MRLLAWAQGRLSRRPPRSGFRRPERGGWNRGKKSRCISGVPCGACSDGSGV